MSIFPTIPIDAATLKAACRSGLSETSREYWWPFLCQSEIRKDTAVTAYPDILAQAVRFASIKKANFTPAAVLSEKKRALKKELIRCKCLEQPILMDGWIQIVAECITDIEICFLILCNFSENKEKYIDSTSVAHKCRLLTFQELLKRYMPRTYFVLEVMGALDDEYLNLMFIDLFRTLIPPQAVLCMVDAFFFEGWRVFMRYGLALFKAYKDQIKAGKFRSANEFWTAVQSRSSLPSSNSPELLSESLKSDKLNGMVESIQDDAFDINRSVFQKLYRPMNISTTKLSEYFSTSSSKIAANSSVSIDFSIFRVDPDFSAVLDSGDEEDGDDVDSEDSLPSSAIRVGEKSGTSQLLSSSTSDGHDSSAALRVYGQAPNESSPGNPIPQAEHKLVDSQILDDDTSHLLLPMLPLRLTFDGMVVSFSSIQHGFSLLSLYEHTRGVAPCVVVVQCNAPAAEVTGGSTNARKGSVEMIVGAYLNCSLSSPSLSTRGDGETFVFRLIKGATKSSSNKENDSSSIVASGASSRVNDLPAQQAMKFSWVGVRDSTATSNPTPGSTSTSTSIPIPSGTQLQFAVCTSEYMSFGASALHSSTALRIDGDLRYVESGPSDTFANPSLLLLPDEFARAQGVAVPGSEGGVATASAVAARSSSSNAALAAKTVRSEILHIEVWCSQSSYRKMQKTRVVKQSVLG